MKEERRIVLFLFVCIAHALAADIYLGGSADFSVLADPNASADLRATGRVGLFGDFSAISTAGDALLGVLNTWEAANNTHGPGQVGLTYNVANLSSLALQIFQFCHAHSWFPDTALVSGPWNTAELGTNISQWRLYVDAARRVGLNTVIPVFLPSGTFGNLTSYNWINSPYWSFLRNAALYGGGLGLHGSPANIKSIGNYSEFVTGVIRWCVQHNIKVSLIIAPTEEDSTNFNQSTVELLTGLLANNSWPTEIVFQCNSVTTNPVGPESAPNTCAAVALWAAKNIPALSNVTQCSLTPMGTGVGLRGAYYNGSFNTLVGTQIDPTVNFDWDLGAPSISGINLASYSVNWTGFVQPRFTGVYTFSMILSGTARLWVNNQLIIDRSQQSKSVEFFGQISLVANKVYPIAVAYTKASGNATIILRWSSICEEALVMSASQLYPNATLVPTNTTLQPFAGTGKGLRADYYTGLNFNKWMGWRVEPTVNNFWDLGKPNGTGIPSNFPGEVFSATYTGFVQPSYSGNWIFSIVVDDGCRLYVNDQLIIDQWADTAQIQRNSVPITLVAGVKYKINVQYYENTKNAIVILYWQLPGLVPMEIIPQSQLYYDFPVPSFEVNMKNDSTVFDAVSGITFSKPGVGVTCGVAHTLAGQCGACNFTGTGSLHLNSPIPPGLPTGSAPKTVCAWGSLAVTVNKNSSGYYMFSFGENNVSKSIFMGTYNGWIRAGGYNDDVDLSSVNGGIWPTNRAWSHVCVSYDGTMANLYFNGTKLVSSERTWNTGDVYTMIGSLGGSQNWVGQIYDVVGWDTALTDMEIQTVYVYPHCAATLPCNNIPFSNVVPDICNVCGGDGTSCLGCDKVAFSNRTIDKCGICAGDNSSCFSLPPSPCGDGICNSQLGEDCNTCLKDCKNSCGNAEYCGDNKCTESIGETCTTCNTDCGTCAVPGCPRGGSGIDCTGRGRCLGGTCSCDDPWTGPACDILPIPVNTSVNASSPSTSLATDSPSSSTSSTFMVSISKIEEIDTDGKMVQFVDVATLDLKLSSVSANNSSMYTYSTTLSNGAQLKIIIWIYLQATKVVFANQTTTIAANAIKFNLGLALWPFRSARNTVSFTIKSGSDQGSIVRGDSCNIDSSTDEGGNLLWFNINYNGLALYGKFLRNALVDQEPKPLSQKMLGNGDILLTLPFFWSEAWIDPDFSVLVSVDKQKNNCYGAVTGNKISNGAVAGVVIGVLCFSAIVAGSYYVWKKRSYVNARSRIRGILYKIK